MDNKENNTPLSGERVPQVKSVEDFAANENEKKSIRDFYEGWKAVHIHNAGLSALCTICPPERYGEDEDCEELQNIIREMYYRISELEPERSQLLEKFDVLESENAKLREALEEISEVTIIQGDYKEAFEMAQNVVDHVLNGTER